MLKRAGCGKKREVTAPISSLVKLEPWFLSLRWKTCLWALLQPWCLNLQIGTCPWAEHSNGDDDDENNCITGYSIWSRNLVSHLGIIAQINNNY